MEVSSYRLDQLLTISSPPPFSREVGLGEAENSQTSNHGLVFLVTSAHLGAVREPTGVTRLEETIPLVLVSWSLQGFLGALCRGSRTETEYVFLRINHNVTVHPWSLNVDPLWKKQL